MARVVDRTGEVTGIGGVLRALRPCGKVKGRNFWEYECRLCGNVKPMAPYAAALYMSCGCRKVEHCVAANTEHGLTNSPEHKVWMGMRARVASVVGKYYRRYRSRGITVCERWDSFANFLADMGPRPTPQHSLDRIDNDGNYEPGNCRWATATEQARNRSTSRYVTIGGVSKTLAALSEETGVPYDVLQQRISMLGWTPERAISQPVRLDSRHRISQEVET